MPVSPGDKLGPYEILASIGAGGMGEVWKARDTRLNREVAIKFSQAQFTDRFQREANTIAALNHPNICTLYDVGPNYLVMELVEGPTLADRIKEGPVPLEETLPIARQIADALEAAHEKGIVHRDLKPANIKIRPDGSVKVLDFGLAKMPDVSAVTSDSPTMLSAQGMILGTASYMAPEQARGKNIDKRADIFAFGAVLYEMLTGKRLFAGEDVTEILASVIRDEPNLIETPPSVRRLISECLQKDPRKRLRDIGDAWKLLDAASASAQSATPDLVSQLQSPKWLWPGVAGLLLLAAGALAFVHFRETPPAALPVSFDVVPPSGAELVAFAISPDGRKLVIEARNKDGHNGLWLRRLDSTEMHELPGTTDAAMPAWSPDSQNVAFLAGGSVKKVDLAGGGAQTLTSYSQSGGLSWGSQNVILFASTSGSQFKVSRISAAGGEVTDVTGKDPKITEMGNGVPFFLPDGRHFLYYRATQKPDKSGIYAGSIDLKPEAQPETRLLDSQQGTVYASVPGSRTGYLFFVRGQALMAQQFDPVRLELQGAPVQIVDHVGTSGRLGEFSVSGTGVLSYSVAQGSMRQLTWYDRGGKLLGHAGEPAMRDELSLSPDGTRVAEGRTADRTTFVVWQLDLTREISSRLTFESSGAGNAVWSPDGRQIVYASGGGRSEDIFLKPANGATQGELLFHSDGTKSPMDWSRDGRYLIFSQQGKGTGIDLWVVPMQGEHKPTPYLVTQFDESQAQFSPDGRWVAYTSNETGTKEVYVRPFPVSSGGKWQISNGGGNEPRWRRDGKELFYVGPDDMLYSVSASAKGDAFQPDTPKPLFHAPVTGGEGGGLTSAWRWDISNDGQRFLVNAPMEGQTAQPVTVVLNWKSGLK